MNLIEGKTYEVTWKLPKKHTPYSLVGRYLGIDQRGSMLFSMKPWQDTVGLYDEWIVAYEEVGEGIPLERNNYAKEN